MAPTLHPTWQLLNPSPRQHEHQAYPSSLPGAGPHSTALLKIPPGTDIWRPRPETDTFTAPYLYTTNKLSSFRRARVTVSAVWKTQFDQGGLMIVFPRAGEATGGVERAETEKVKGAQWIKAGIEFFAGAPQLGVVATDRVSDWSLSPLLGSTDPASASASASGEKGTEAATIEIEFEDGGAWVYSLEGEGEGGAGKRKRRALREVKWAGLQGRRVDEEVLIGVYGAKPTPEEGERDEGMELVVEFEGFEIETVDGMVV